MSKFWKRAIVSFFMAFACWYLAIVIIPDFEVLLIIAAVAASILCVCFFVTAIIKQTKPNVSNYKIFAWTDGLIGIGVAIYAIHDILTDTGWFAGLFGTLLLIFVVPVAVLLLIIDFILYRRSKKINEIR